MHCISTGWQVQGRRLWGMANLRSCMILLFFNSYDYGTLLSPVLNLIGC